MRSIGVTIPTLVGGGLIEPFAWGSDAPTAAAVDGTVSVGPAARPFTLADASGTSSSAFAAMFEKIKLLDGLLPEQNYWPPVATGAQPKAQLFDFGDGGNLENYGLIPLLMRGVKKIVVFINTETPMSTSYDPTIGTVTNNDMDSSFPPLFGIPFSSGGDPTLAVNQVFSSNDFAPVVQALQAKKKAGQPLVTSYTHTIQPNPWWGVPGSGTVEVLYVYLDQVQSWRNLLTDEWVKIQLDLGDAGEFPHFPNYKTIDENIFPPWGLTELTARQVNLLADLTCWVITQSGDVIKKFLAS
ncbi:MAG: hypothetical protein ACLGH0_13360 [Thermoanaerobaculia bacterium]